MSKSFSSIDPKKTKDREDINSQIMAFLSGGGSIQQVPSGVCASTPLDMAGYNEQTYRNRSELFIRRGKHDNA